MQGVISAPPEITQRRDLFRTVTFVFARVKRTLFICWHRSVSLPITRGQKTYRSCVKCGMCQRFDLKTWRSFGPFYRNELTQLDGRERDRWEASAYPDYSAWERSESNG